MSTESSVHSNALNFMSFMESGVDSRTGQYTLAIKLSELGANYFCGPDIELSLNFNPLNTADTGWGRGWNLSLTQLIPRDKNVITTSTGESFKVTGSSGKQLQMKEQRLAHFHLYSEPAGPAGDKRYRVVHRSGMVEILEEMGSGERRTALPVEIYSATGHKIVLTYNAFKQDYRILGSISDERGILLEVQRTDDRIELRERPYEGGNGKPVAVYVMNLGDTDRVRTIVLPTEEQAHWYLDYREVLGLLCVSEVRTPTGAREYVHYQDGGHQFPGISRALPRVTRHIIEPRGGQPAFQRTYEYPDTRNFLGNGAGVVWADDGLDSLYNSARYDFEYQSIETLRDDKGTPLNNTTRTFNRFHLLTSTRTVQNNCVHEVMTAYDIKDAPFDEQVPTLQMPIRQQTRWSQADTITRSRIETAETRYDTHGNITWRQLANGVTETNTWYTQVEDGYPGDANGFIRHLKSRTTTPASTGEGPAHIRTHQYRYRALKPLTGTGITLNPAVVEHSETLVDEGNPTQPLEQRFYSYIEAPWFGLLHGRRYQEVVKRNKLESTTQYQFEPIIDSPDIHPALETRKILIGYDGAQRSTVQRRSLLHGEKLYELDENGVHTQWSYDALRRVTEESVSPDTPFAASRRYKYQLCANPTDVARHWATNARGITTETELDGLGRPILEKRDNVYEARPGSFFEILAIKYDAYGKQVQESVTDYLEGIPYLQLVTKTLYDDWGEPRCTIGPDGVEQHDVLDPIGTATHKGAIRCSWREGGRLQARTQVHNRNGRNVRLTRQARAISGKTETWLNLFNKPVLRMRLNALGELLGERRYSYDGLGRALSERDERYNTTAFSYDAWDRMLTTVLPNKTVLTRTYAEHAADDLPASLVVTPANVLLPARQIGAQYHDGLDRLMGATSGDRTEYFLFRDGESMPRQRISPAGETIELDYNLQLTNEPISNTAPDERASFHYDLTSARLLSNDNGQGQRSFEYNKANQLIAEHWHDNSSGTTLSRTHLSTLQNRPKKTQEDPYGVDTTHEYDDHGRLASTLQGELRADFTYDDLGRLQLITSHDRVSGRALETEIEYDDQDREIKRIWRQPGQPERALETGWGKDDLMSSRTLQVGGVSRLVEAFFYDTHSRLFRHTCTGPDLPRDALGRSIELQIFSFDAYDNIQVISTKLNGVNQPELAKFIHADRDPCQLQRIEYTPPRAQPNPSFSYDANGNLTRDEQGRTIRYDSQDRLLALNNPGGADTYGYDAGGSLVSRPEDGKRALLLHDGQRLRMAVRDGLHTLYLHHGEQPLGQQQTGAGAQSPLLLHTSASHSVVAESQGGSTRAIRYTAYGEQHADDQLVATLGYNGEALDPDSGWYLLGNGYRAYNPALMRFHSPDALSPFGEGGLNYYGYCQGNPVTFRDPTGHYSIGYSGTSQTKEDLEWHRISPRVQLGVVGWIGMGIGFALAAVASVVAVVATAGVAAPAVAAAWTAAGGGLAGTAAAVSAGAGAFAGLSLAAGIKLAATVATATLSVAGTVLQTEGTLSGHETRNNIGAILNYAALAVGVFAGALKFAPSLLKPGSRTGGYTLNQSFNTSNWAGWKSINVKQIRKSHNRPFEEFIPKPNGPNLTFKANARVSYGSYLTSPSKIRA